MKIPLDVGEKGYTIYLERGALFKAREYMNLSRRVLVVTDDGVPPQYAKSVLSQCRDGFLKVVPQGESSKSMEMLCQLLGELTENGFTRSDCVIAVGGGVVGDLAGFAAATYMRGIDFYNIPTTLLSQVDSSIGGKVAVDFMGYKNIVGAFHQPRAVIVDPELLSTLPERQIANGLVEAVKMAMTSDAELFGIFERGEQLSRLDEVIEKSLLIKKSVVESDEKEAGLRRILNFGHTLAHGIESEYGVGAWRFREASEKGLYHGECVALGVVPMCRGNARERAQRVLEKIGAPVDFSYDLETALAAIKHDKKASDHDITVVFVDVIGSFDLQKLPLDEYLNYLRKESKK